MWAMPVGLFGGAAGFALVPLGTNTNTTNNATIALTVPAGGVPAGALIVVCVATSNQSVTFSSGTDTASNTYAVAAERGNTPGTTTSIHIIYAMNATALVNGNTITMTMSASNTDKMISVAYITAAKTTLALDATQTATNSNTTPTATTAATTQASEIVVGAISIGSYTVTEDGSYTTLHDVTGAARKLHTAYRVLVATGAQTYAPTVGTSDRWGEAMATFKAGP